MYTKLTSLDILSKSDDSIIKAFKMGTIEFLTTLTEDKKKTENILLFNPSHKKFTAAELREIADIMDFNAEKEIEEYGTNTNDINKNIEDNLIDTGIKDEDEVKYPKQTTRKVKRKKKTPLTHMEKVEDELKRILTASLNLENSNEEIIGLVYHQENKSCTVTLKVSDGGDHAVFFGDSTLWE